MNPTYDFATPFQEPRGSAIRELFKYLSQPGMISFAGGYPSPALFDTAGLNAAMVAAQSASAADLLQYGATEGRPQMRAALCDLLARRGIAAMPEQMLVTSGSQQGFDLLLRTLIEPGDTAIVTRPVYSAAAQGLRLAGANVVAVATGEEGIGFDELERHLAAGKPRPKLFYCVPTFANPSGDTFPLAQRQRLLELAVRHRLLIVEDDPYGQLRFSGEPLPALFTLARDMPGASDWVVHLSSLSKIVAPGLRIGMMLAPPEVLRRCVMAKQTSDLCTSPWMQIIAERYLDAGALERHLHVIVDAYRNRCDTLVAALRKELAHAFEFSVPQGGMFVWGQWKHGVDATRVLEHAIKANVMYVPGISFYTDQANPSALRLSFAMPTVDEIGEGVRRLRAAYDSYTAAQLLP
jgi:2-aminoadipate transaminase